MKKSVYEYNAFQELKIWQKKMLKKPSVFNRLTKNIQHKMNNLLPEKIQQAITEVMKNMIKVVLFGAEKTTLAKRKFISLETTEKQVIEKIEFYRKTAAIEGGITGAGGILLGLADLPLLISLKIKLLFEIASVYGFDVTDYKERLYILHIFQLAFSSEEHRREVYLQMAGWDKYIKSLPEDVSHIDWKTFQQEYRDYIDLAKLAQLMPLIGALVGYVVNNRLIKKLGFTAMNAYRMRLKMN